MFTPSLSTPPRLAWRQLAFGLGCAALIVSSGWLMIAQAKSPTAKASSAGQARHLTFTHPSPITNTYLPLSKLHQDVLEGNEGRKKMRIERTRKPGTRTFMVNGKPVVASIVEDREWSNGKVEEVTLDYFAQSDDGSVCYMGESVDNYRNGKVVGHEGAWLTGEHNAQPGIIIPGHPKLGDKFHSENVPGITVEADEVVAVDETVTVRAGTYKHCVKIKEMVSGEDPEYKYYAPNVGVVREVPAEGNMQLISHK
ncbi:MAG: hypothetical protein JO316_21720 [Abitibacteriaceae bacterium]|nr:hypothetical protein [Abditibacteriaceae bacterium]